MAFCLFEMLAKRMHLAPAPFPQKPKMRADDGDDAEFPLDIDPDGAARLQPRQGQARRGADVEIVAHQNRVCRASRG